MSWEYHMCCGCGYAEEGRRNYEWNDWVKETRKVRLGFSSLSPIDLSVYILPQHQVNKFASRFFISET